MPRWIQIDGELVPADKVPRRERKGPYIQGDIQPYQVVGGPRYGEWITSRSEHREYLRQNNFIEAGNERKAFGLPDPKDVDNGR